jgi:GNAT superfamily N-acetyltransferase
VELTFRHWSLDDRRVLTGMIEHCLEENFLAGAEMKPSEKNADVLFQLGLHWSQLKQPTYIAEHKGQPCAYTLWGALPNPMELDMRWKDCAGLGTYVAPWARRQGVASDLRTHALAHAKALGFERVTGVTYHWPGLSAVYRLGFEAVGTQVVKVL